MEAGKYSQLQEEMKAVIRKLYQNQQEKVIPMDWCTYSGDKG